MTTTAEPTDSSAAPADEHLAVLMADRATLGATLDRFAAAFTALAALLGAAPDAELVDRVRAGPARAEEHLVFERETMLVRAAYAEFGLAAPRLNKEPDDHIGLELSFLATLCVRGMDALDDADDAELGRLLRGIRSFLADHLLVWAPKCLTQAAEGATTHFYQGVAALGLGALAAAEDAFLRVP